MRRIAALQDPRPSKTVRGSRILRMVLYGRVGMRGSIARAKCAPHFNADSEAATWTIRMARTASKL